MKYKHGLAFPDSDSYLFDRMPEGRLWQGEAYQAGISRCKSCRTAIDGGAHIGTWSLAMSKSFDSVIAFEPSPDTFEALLVNTEGSENIQARQCALGANSGLVSMYWRPKDQRRKHTGARYIQPGGDIEVKTIDSLNLDDVDFIKLDLEGGEPDALKGAVETLRKCKPVIVFEDKGFSKRFGYPESESRDFLSSLGAFEFERAGINRIWGWE